MQTANSCLLFKVMYNQAYDRMNQMYVCVDRWPHPYSYYQWYVQLPEIYQAQNIHPSDYSVLHGYAVERWRQEREAAAPGKLSRGQKRKMKKRSLQEELESERREIGDWVRTERKDLINGIAKIEEKERQMKQKRKNKLSYLIEIHKQVYRTHKERNSEMPGKKRRVKDEDSKKRLSYIKKMKIIYEKRKTGKEENEEDEDWKNDSSDSQQQQKEEEEKGKEKEKEKEIESKQPSKSVDIAEPVDIKTINYKQIGKLTGVKYQDVRMREWVRNQPSEQLEKAALILINLIANKQAMKRIKQPNKAKKLIVSGLKECKRTLRTIDEKKKSRMLIVALNIERNPLQKGVDDEVQNVLEMADKIPVLHISTRGKLARAFTGKFGPRITMVSIINYEGFKQKFDQLLTLWKQSCQIYEQL